MTASKSKSNNFTWINYKQKLSDPKIFIMLVILNLMALPYLFVTSYFNQEEQIVVSLFAFALIFGAGLLIPLLKFSYLNQRAKVDMVYALPLTRTQQFFSDYFAGLSLYLIPYLIQMIVILLLPTFFTLTKEELANSYSTIRFLLDREWVFSFTLIVMCIMILLYTLTVFIISCTGSLFEAISASIYCNFLIPLLFWTINNNIIGSLYSINDNELLYEILKRTSPIGGLLYLVEDFYRVAWTKIFGYILPVLILVVILCILSYFIQSRRKAEDVSKPFVNQIFYYFVLGSFIFIIGTILFKSETSYVSLVLILTIIFILFELISNRGFMKLYKSLIRYAVILSGFLIFLFVYTKTEGFGLVYRITNPSNLNSITYSFDGVFLQTSYRLDPMIISDPENLSILHNFQQNQIKKYKVNYKTQNINESTPKLGSSKEYGFATEFGTNPITENIIYTNPYYFDMEFDVKIGIDYNRYYDVTYDDLITLAPIELSDSYIDAMIDSLLNESHIYSYISDNYSIRTLDLNESKKDLIYGLLETLRLDLKEISLESYLKPSTATGIVLTFSDDFKISLNPEYKHTIAYLKEKNLWIDTTDADYQSLLAISDIYLVSPEDTKYPESTYYTSSEDYSSLIVNNKITELTDDVIALLDNAAYHYVTDEPVYYLYVNGYRYIIPAEYTDTAESVFNYFSK